jgi:hypothetical protein
MASRHWNPKTRHLKPKRTKCMQCGKRKICRELPTVDEISGKPEGCVAYFCGDCEYSS